MTVQSAALDPVRAALLSAAGVDARREVAAAQQQADTVIAQARARAKSILDDAETQGRADAEALLARERIRAQQAAREVELRAQRETYEELRRRVAERVTRWRGDPRLRQGLAARIHAVLGAAAEVIDTPDGGAIGLAGRRRLDLSLQAVASRAVDDLGAEVRQLWTP